MQNDSIKQLFFFLSLSLSAAIDNHVVLLLCFRKKKNRNQNFLLGFSSSDKFSSSYLFQFSPLNLIWGFRVFLSYQSLLVGKWLKLTKWSALVRPRCRFRNTNKTQQTFSGDSRRRIRMTRPNYRLHRLRSRNPKNRKSISASLWEDSTQNPPRKIKIRWRGRRRSPEKNRRPTGEKFRFFLCRGLARCRRRVIVMVKRRSGFEICSIWGEWWLRRDWPRSRKVSGKNLRKRCRRKSRRRRRWRPGRRLLRPRMLLWVVPFVRFKVCFISFFVLLVYFFYFIMFIRSLTY